MFSGLAQLIVLSLVVLFVLSSEHSTPSRLLVAGAYGLAWRARDELRYVLV